MRFLIILVILFYGLACDSTLSHPEILPNPQELPYLGKHKEITIENNGELRDSIIHHAVPPFQMTNQYGKAFGSDELKGKIYLTEFFFTSCPSVCPKVAKQMVKIHDMLSTESQFVLVSFTLDPKRDTAKKLNQYANEKGVNHSNWHFLTGDRDTIYDLAEESYFVAAFEDEIKKRDNIMHDGVLVLVDGKGHIRGMYDGKDKQSVSKIINAVNILTRLN